MMPQGWRRSVPFRARRLAVAAVAAVTVPPVALHAQAQDVVAMLERSTVRVIVPTGPAQGAAASGFVWGSRTQVVTALHALVGQVDRIRVMCGNERIPASVARVHVASDLALLTLDAPFAACAPLAAAVAREKPSRGTRLVAFGFHAGASGGSTRSMTKEYINPETLMGMLNDQVRAKAVDFGMPSVTDGIYYVEGGLLPGYSGGPVVEESSGRLVGIVDGGLNQGMSGYNWVIPASRLDDLFASRQTTVPSSNPAAARDLFSSGIALAEELAPRPPVVQVVRTAAERGVIEATLSGTRHVWVRTKTLSLAQLARTADDPDGLLHLVGRFGGVPQAAAMQLRFDIYQELEKGLLIATPAGRAPGPSGEGLELDGGPTGEGLVFIPVPAIDLATNKPSVTGEVAIPDPAGGLISARDPRFLRQVPAFAKSLCEDRSNITCTVDEATYRLLDFGDGNRVLRFGMVELDHPPGRAPSRAYHYISFALRGAAALLSDAQVSSESGTDLLMCRDAATSPADCATSAHVLDQLHFVLASHLTSLLQPRADAQRRVREASVGDLSRLAQDRGTPLNEQAARTRPAPPVAEPVPSRADRVTAPAPDLASARPILLGYVTLRALATSQGRPTALFRAVAPLQWQEADPTTGAPRFGFREVGRDDWSVYLVDDTRNVRLQLDRYRRKVRYAEGAGEYRDLYDIGEEPNPPVILLGRVATLAIAGSLQTGEAVARFVNVQPGVWEQRNAAGTTVQFTFREVQRDDWSVYLRLDAQQADLQLDFYRNVAIVRRGNQPPRDVWRLVPPR